jgi:hypothetical protein
MDRADSSSAKGDPGDPFTNSSARVEVCYGRLERHRSSISEDNVLANIAAIAQWADSQNRENVAFARLYRDSAGPFPQRRAVVTLTGKFMTDFADMLAGWAEWAAETVATWPDDITAAEPDRHVLDAIASRPVDPAPLRPGPSVHDDAGGGTS